MEKTTVGGVAVDAVRNIVLAAMVLGLDVKSLSNLLITILAKTAVAVHDGSRRGVHNFLENTAKNILEVIESEEHAETFYRLVGVDKD